ncbi:unnamed protein product [Lymnaea stagnalis]|uniref:Nose resistant-to-fluoxetine protein N-terminal domain-containing protein n=1 Tax=Lymnaea stagnalis TaxID=6523 RepID=A0AAV2HLR9_LYMST
MASMLTLLVLVWLCLIQTSFQRLQDDTRGLTEFGGDTQMSRSGGAVYEESLKILYSELTGRKHGGLQGLLEKSGQQRFADDGSAGPRSSDGVFGESTGVDSNNQTDCQRDFQRFVSSLMAEEQWALRMFDAWGKPGPSVLEGRLNLAGSYEQCRNFRAPSVIGGNGTFGGNYCVIEMIANLAAMVQLGSCLPDTCTETEAGDILSKVLEPLNHTLTLVQLECRSDHREFTTATILAIVILPMLGLLCLVGSIYDLIVVKWPKRMIKSIESVPSRQTSVIENKSTKDEELGVSSPDSVQTSKKVGQNNQADTPDEDESTSFKETTSLLGYKEAKRTNVLADILLAFSVLTNGPKLLSTAQPPGTLTAINGIRFLSMAWVIIGHTFNVALSILGNTPLFEIRDHLNRWTFDAIANASVSVDTFFTLSGLLVAYVASKELMKKGWKINWARFYFHRYWRLTPPYMLSILLVVGFQQFMGSGALWPKQMPVDKVNCEDNWWTNLLYINNLVRNDKMCFDHSWYLANDMQFYIISPLMLVPFVFHVYAGVASCFFFLTAQWVTAAVLATDNEWTATAVYNGPVKPGALNWQLYYYYAPYCRIGPYVVGILAGYLLASKNGRLQMSKVVAVSGWAVAIATALSVLYGIRGDISGERFSSVGVASFYNAVSRSAWGASVAWVIVACASGCGGPVNKILSWSPFVPLGRLSYMSYLIHPCLIIAYFGNQESPYYITDTNIAISFLGMLGLVNMVSFVLVLGLESPMIGLEKLFLGKKKT